MCKQCPTTSHIHRWKQPSEKLPFDTNADTTSSYIALNRPIMQSVYVYFSTGNWAQHNTSTAADCHKKNPPNKWAAFRGTVVRLSNPGDMYLGPSGPHTRDPTPLLPRLASLTGLLTCLVNMNNGSLFVLHVTSRIFVKTGAGMKIQSFVLEESPTQEWPVRVRGSGHGSAGKQRLLLIYKHCWRLSPDSAEYV